MEKSEKPIKEWLKELPEPIRELGIKRYEEGRSENKFIDSIYEALNSAFDWEDTKEGANFWYMWYCLLVQNTNNDNVFTDPKDYSGLPMPDGFLKERQPQMAFEGLAEKYEAGMAADKEYIDMYSPWTPVERNLPANNQKVLVCWSHTPVWEPSEAYYVDGKFYPERGAAPYFRVTHWMEMPKGVTE